MPHTPIPYRLLPLLALGPALAAATVSGELKQWHALTLDFTGPASSETATPNPFTDYRLDVTFRHPASGRTLVAPGFFAADGAAADSGATAGSRWRCHFCPDATGAWTWSASFRTGADVAMAASATAGTAAGFCNGESGTVTIAASDKTGRDLRHHGRLRYVGEHYLRFAGSGAWFLKVGPDSPEGMLANPDIDCEDPAGTRASFSAHAQHWLTGDPSWKAGKGKAIVGAVNHIADQGMNCFYVLTYTGHGDTKSVWPFRRVDDRRRMDCSKLDQWRRVLAHMNHRGIQAHLVLTETENESYWEKADNDSSGFAPSRKLYYREMLARFADLPGVMWNLGEEIGWSDSKGGTYGLACTDAQRKAWSSWLRGLDPYDAPIVCHTLPGGSWDSIYSPLLGFADYEGISGQFSLNPNGMNTAHATIKTWIDRSAAAGRKWVVSNDEVGGDNLPLIYKADGTREDTAGIRPDVLDADHDYARQWALWGSLMAGAAGVESYFGWYFTPQGGGDGAVSNFAAWNNWWRQCRIAHTFFTTHLPFWLMHHDDGLTASTSDFCFAQRGEVYVIYLRQGGTTDLDLLTATDRFGVQWYDPRNGGALRDGSVTTITGPGRKALGDPPSDAGKDWAVLVKRLAPVNQAPTVSLTAPTAGLVVDAGRTVDLTATASDSDGTVATVEFLVDGVVKASDTAAPFAATWIATGTGTHTLSARATDDDGATTTSTPRTVTVNALPTVAITSPMAGRAFLVGQSIRLTANAADADGAIARVEFLANGTLITTERQAPWDWSWTAAGAGTQVITARAYDDRGAMTVSTPVTVTVAAPFAARVNFQPVGTPLVDGWSHDNGLVFGARSGGLSYGWNQDIAATARDRNHATSVDQLHDTLLHLQKPATPDARWEIAVPNGTFQVRLVAGDPQFFDSRFRIAAEGVAAIDGLPTTAERWLERSVTVTVDDGRLTIASLADADNNKLCLVEILQIAPQPGANG